MIHFLTKAPAGVVSAFVSPWHVLVSVEMVKPEGQAQEKPPMMLLQEWEQGDWSAHSSSSNKNTLCHDNNTGTGTNVAKR